MNIILFDAPWHTVALRPFTYLRPVAALRVGMWTLAEKWRQRFDAHHASLSAAKEYKGHSATVEPSTETCQISYLTAPYLRAQYPARITHDNLLIHGAICPDDHFFEALRSLTIGTALYGGSGESSDTHVLAARVGFFEESLPEDLSHANHRASVELATAEDKEAAKRFENRLQSDRSSFMPTRSFYELTEPMAFLSQIQNKHTYENAVRLLESPYHMLRYNEEELLTDMAGCSSQDYRTFSHEGCRPLWSEKKPAQQTEPIHEPETDEMHIDTESLSPDSLKTDPGLVKEMHSNVQTGFEKSTGSASKNKYPLYIAADVHIGEAVIFNTQKGPICLHAGARIEDAAIIQGPCSVGVGASVQAGARIRGGTTIGPYCKLGGEVVASIFLGYANKAHEGFMGHSVVGEWCNLGAGTTCSNLKNTYSSVKLWNARAEDFIDTDAQFCGLMMGDHSKSGIQSMFNTGTVLGVSTHVYGAGFPAKHIPSFSWAETGKNFRTFALHKAEEVAEMMMNRRALSFEKEARTVFRYVFALTHDSTRRIGERK